MTPRRAIPWESLDLSSLPTHTRQIVGESWRERRKQEHLAVGAFALLSQELAGDGCDPVVLDLATRAANDEVRHAEVCRRMAVALLGDQDVPHRLRGLPRVPLHRDVDPGERVLLHVVEMCCLSETLTGVYFTEMHARATKTARIAVEDLLEDEIDHGRLGWAYVATRAREGRIRGLAAALPALLDRTVGRALRQAERSPEAEGEMETFGWLGRSAAVSAIRRGLREVIAPGFETLGIDMSLAAPTINGFLGG